MNPLKLLSARKVTPIIRPLPLPLPARYNYFLNKPCSQSLGKRTLKKSKPHTKSGLLTKSMFAMAVIEELQTEKISRDAQLAGKSIARSYIAPSKLKLSPVIPLTLLLLFRECQRANWKQHKLICGKPLEYDMVVKLATSPSTSDDPSDIPPPANGFKPPLDVGPSIIHRSFNHHDFPSYKYKCDI